MRDESAPSASPNVTQTFLPEDTPSEEPPPSIKVQPRDMLNALSELLLEKGILTLEELAERVLQLQARHPSSE